MHVFATIAGILIIFAVLLDAFETVVLPRRVQRKFRITTWFYRRTWIPWRKMASHIKSASRRENVLGYFGPLSLLVLLGLWATGLIFGFALLQYGAGEHVQLGNERITFGDVVYHSGETFFTLGYGDIVPTSAIARALAVLEAGMGFGFLGTVIGYLPTIYSSFSRREVRDFPARRPRRITAHRCGVAWPGSEAVRNRPSSTRFFATVSAGRAKFWRVISRILRSVFFAPSTAINPGWAR